LRSTRLGIVFLDDGLNITRFTPAVAQIMNLLDRDIGRPIAHLSLKFQADWFFPSIEEVARSKTPIERELVTSDDRVFLLRIEPYVSEGLDAGGLVVTAVEVTAVKQAERRLALVLDALPQQVALLDVRGTITLVNRAWTSFCRANGGREDATGVGANYLAVCASAMPSTPEVARVVEKIEDLLAGRSREAQVEYPCHSATEKRWFLMQATPIDNEAGGLVVSHVNITERKLMEIALTGAPGT